MRQFSAPQNFTLRVTPGARKSWSLALLLGVLPACGDGGAPSPLVGHSPTGIDAGATVTDARASGTLDAVAAITAANCARAGCHDPVTRSHDMDLSTSQGVYTSWVNKKGLNHCDNTLVVRVVPGDPDASYVITKISAADKFCELSQRMPPPPWSRLSTEEIRIIRSWISEGAPAGNLLPADDGGVAPRDGATAAIDQDGAMSDGEGAPGCTKDLPCDVGQSCAGFSCDDRWECITHDDDTLEHPCTPDMVPYCGCDGVTFYASTTCPDRPYERPGGCEEDANCNPADIRCSALPPDCADGEGPSVVGGCYGPCVPVASCRCEVGSECPVPEKYGCWGDERRCHAYPLPRPSGPRPGDRHACASFSRSRGGSGRRKRGMNARVRDAYASQALPNSR